MECKEGNPISIDDDTRPGHSQSFAALSILRVYYWPRNGGMWSAATESLLAIAEKARCFWLDQTITSHSLT